MKISLFSILLASIIFGCVRSALVKEEHYISNYTHKIIVHELELNDPVIGQELLSFYIDKPCIDSLEWRLIGKKGRYLFFIYDYIYIYNLSDTTSIKLPFFSKRFAVEENGDLASFLKKKNNRHDSYLIINDSFLTLFQKDTSMLTKFKDYYNKK